jgi:putative ABC transport system permease protein
MRKALRDMRLLRGQLVAIILLVAAGSATFIMMRSMHSSLMISLQTYYQAQGYPDIFIDVKQAPNSMHKALSQVDGVSDVRLRLRHRVSVDIPGLEEVASAEVVSLPTDDSSSLSSLHYVRGSAPDAGSVAAVVLYAPFAEANNLSVGDSISVLLNGIRTRLRIAGTAISPEYLIIMSPGTLMLDNRRNGVLWMHDDVLATRFNMIGGWNSAALRVRSGVSPSRLRPVLDEIVRPFGSFGTSLRNDQLSHRFITDEIRQNEVSALIIPSIIYGVAIFLLNISISRLVVSQRSIIAVLRAFGYSRGAIAGHYVVMAMVVVALGTIIGTAIGYAGGIRLADWYMEFYRFPRLIFAIPNDAMLIAVGLAVLAAVAGTAGAIRSVFNMQPAEAMKPPAPKTFHPGPLTHISTVCHVKTTTRLMLQNIDRRLLPSIVVLAMIALATSIILLARYIDDAMDHMMHVEYDKSKLASATVTFNRAVPFAAARELESIDGITRSEPFRSIAVDVLASSEIYRTTLSSRNPDSRLIRIVDGDGIRQPVPLAGMAMTEYLAKRLGMHIGDTVRIALLEYRRDTVSMVLASTPREALGAQCYATIEELSALCHEEPLANGAFIESDPKQTVQIQSKLKDRPAVIGVLFRDVAIASFTEVYGGNVLVVALYLLLLACLVAIGVLYNNARIVIADRSAELASMRIQGFTVGEVARIILGEQYIVTVVGIPVGVAIGIALSYMISTSVEADFLRIPFVESRMTVLISASVIIVVSAFVALRIYFMLQRLDLVAVLKERI